MIDITIVIVSYNVKDLLRECLLSIQKNTINTIEIIVIDNDSKDGSLEMLTKDFPNVILIANKYNAGFSGANNQGMNIAKGKYIFLLNPDTEIVDGAISQLLDYLNNSKSCAIVAPQLLNSDGSIQTSAWKNHSVVDLIIETFFLHKLFNFLEFSANQLKTTFEVKTLSGAALFFRKDLVDKIGLLDKHLFWMEDIDFCFRAQKYGSIIYLHSAQVIHHSGQSQKKNYNVAIANQLLSKLKYYKKHSSWFSVVLANLSCFIFIITRLLALSVLIPFKEIYKLKAKAYFYSLNRFLSYLFLNDYNIL